MAILLAVLVISNSSSIGISSSSAYYALGIMFLLWIPLMKNSKMTILSYPMLGVYLAGFLSILFNDIPPYYNSEQRFLMFICFTLLIGPFLGGNKFTLFRKYLFYYSNIFIIVLSSLSCLGLITGIYSSTDRGGLSGLFGHSMLLSPMAGIGLLSCLYFFYSTHIKKLKSFLLLCSLLCFVSAVAAGSRSALMGTAVGILFFFYKLYKNRISKYIQVVFLLLFLGISSFPLWENQTTFLMKKVSAAEEADNWTSSRETIWEHRIIEIQTSPVIGVGFAAEQSDSFGRSEEEIEESGGNIEPGSSWLAIMSMTGILGFIPIFVLFLSDFKFILTNKKNRLWLSYLGSILSLFTLHMMAEGYVFAFGSLLFFYLWLMLGVIQITQKEVNFCI